ncbi:MAG: hypothetical protein GX637_06990 [Clostridiales bacterium]|nr:hypothetical protein [Clostridiales bacterium]
MSDALRVMGFAALAAAAAFSLRSVHRQAGAAVALAAGVMLFSFAMTRVQPAVQAVESLSRRAGVAQGTSGLLIKLVGMAYITEFAVQLCRDAGEEGLAAKAALCGKMLLLLETLPLVIEIGEIALSLSP